MHPIIPRAACVSPTSDTRRRWLCLSFAERLVIGTGAYRKSPVMTEVKREAERRKVELVIVPTAAAIEELRRDTAGTNAILHVTC